jgi:hypothetical protein
MKALISGFLLESQGLSRDYFLRSVVEGRQLRVIQGGLGSIKREGSEPTGSCVLRRLRE